MINSLFEVKKILVGICRSHQNKLPLRNLYLGIACKRLKNKNYIFSKNIEDLLHLNKMNYSISEEERQSIIQSANRFINGYYNSLGSGEVLLRPIDWHTDFKSGYRWNPGTFYKKYKQVNLLDDSDVKVPRELSRSHHLLHLALAFQFTKQNKYKEECYNQIFHWIEANPLMYSINWGCAMDVAIRAVNWIWALGILKFSPAIDDKDGVIQKSLYEHGWYVFGNLEGGVAKLGSNGNHYLADLVGLIHLGLLFKDTKEGRKWLTEGISSLYREVRYEILPSGMTYEKSTNYNRLVLELIFTSIVLLKRNNYDIPSDIDARVESMFEFIMNTLYPNGMSPIIGDQDNGRLLPFGTEDINDFRYLLSIGAILYKRPDFKKFSSGYNIYCDIFSEGNGYIIFDKIKNVDKRLLSRRFSDIGYYIFRNKKSYMLFNANGIGFYRDVSFKAGHTHSDLFSFDLYVNNKPFIVDPGSYVYTSNPQMRQYFRSTSMHNTIVVDKRNQDDIKPDMLFGYDRKTKVEILDFYLYRDEDMVRARHNAYSNGVNEIYHTREIILNKIEDSWTITDIMEGKEKHLYQVFFHFDKEVDFDVVNNELNFKSLGVKMVFESNQNMKIIKEDSYVSKSYGVKYPAKVIIVESKCKSTFELSTKILKI